MLVQIHLLGCFNHILIDAKLVKSVVDRLEGKIVEGTHADYLELCETSVPEEEGHIGESREMRDGGRTVILGEAEFHHTVESVQLALPQLGVVIAVGHSVIGVPHEIAKHVVRPVVKVVVIHGLSSFQLMRINCIIYELEHLVLEAAYRNTTRIDVEGELVVSLDVHDPVVDR